ncbi:MAG: ribonuclease D [Kiloniellales bacterium]
MTYHLHVGDLPEGLDLGPLVAVDSETMGLAVRRDRLCLVQLSSGDGDAHLVQIPERGHKAPRLAALMRDPAVIKLFHFARFDIAAIGHWLEAWPAPIYCTKVASKLVRTYTDRHGLKDLCREILGVDLSKQQQSSDWGAARLSDEQLRYAASDVLHLHALKERLDLMLEREERTALAQAIFDFLPSRARLDLLGWADVDILAH